VAPPPVHAAHLISSLDRAQMMPGAISLSFQYASTTSGAPGSMRAISLISEPSEDSTDVIPISI
jgi:hypothetical protein